MSSQTPQTAAPSATPTTAPRVRWIDSARGLAIVLVVLLHATEWLDVIGLTSTRWLEVGQVLATLRMPLFFMAAGLLGAAWLGRSWPEVLSRKVLFLFWVYLLWQPIGTLAALVTPQFQAGQQFTVVGVLASLAATPVRPRFELWFLWALSLFFVLSRLTVRVPRRVQFGVAGVVAAVWLSRETITSNLGWDGFAKYYVFFLIGLYGRELLLYVASRMTVPVSLACIAGWAVVVVAAFVLDLDGIVGVGLLMRLVGLVGGIALAVRLVPVGLFEYLGSRTLQIYLAHVPVLVLLTWGISNLPRATAESVAPALPLIITTIAVSVGLALFALLTRTPARVMYAPPARVVSVVRDVAAARLGTAPLPPVRSRGRHADDAPRRLAA